jgi:hypothetical protein
MFNQVKSSHKRQKTNDQRPKTKTKDQRPKTNNQQPNVPQTPRLLPKHTIQHHLAGVFVSAIALSGQHRVLYFLPA